MYKVMNYLSSYYILYLLNERWLPLFNLRTELTLNFVLSPGYLLQVTQQKWRVKETVCGSKANYAVAAVENIAFSQGLVISFCKGPSSEYFRLCAPRDKIENM